LESLKNVISVVFNVILSLPLVLFDAVG